MQAKLAASPLFWASRLGAANHLDRWHRLRETAGSKRIAFPRHACPRPPPLGVRLWPMQAIEFSPATSRSSAEVAARWLSTAGRLLQPAHEARPAGRPEARRCRVLMFGDVSRFPGARLRLHLMAPPTPTIRPQRRGSLPARAADRVPETSPWRDGRPAVRQTSPCARYNSSHPHRRAWLLTPFGAASDVAVGWWSSHAAPRGRNAITQARWPPMETLSG